MLGIQYIKVSPTNHIIHYQSGKIAHSGVGLAFFYYAPYLVDCHCAGGQRGCAVHLQ